MTDSTRVDDVIEIAYREVSQETAKDGKRRYNNREDITAAQLRMVDEQLTTDYARLMRDEE